MNQKPIPSIPAGSKQADSIPSTSPIRIFPLGACHLHAPLNTIMKTDRSVAYANLSRGPLPGVYSFGEIEQLFRILNGDLRMPPALWPFAKYVEDFRMIPGGINLEDVDVVLVELNTPVDIKFRSFYLNRAGVGQRVVYPLGLVGRQAKKSVNAWFKNGLLANNRALQLELAEELIPLIPQDVPNPKLVSLILREAQAERRDLFEGLAKIRELAGHRPLGIMTYIFQYLPDGRIITWPERFRDEVIAFATNHGIPLFDPPSLVLKHGLETALGSDLRHYREDFLPTVGAALVDFTRQVLEQSGALAAE
jgi:hypothetical protein